MLFLILYLQNHDKNIFPNAQNQKTTSNIGHTVPGPDPGPGSLEKRTLC